MEYLRQNEYKETVDCEVSICHNVVQYSDDSTIVASNNNIIIQKYFKKYFKMNDNNLNKLMRNSGKSKLIGIGKVKSVMMNTI